MSTREIKIANIDYSILPLDAFSQLTLARKGAPIFLGLSNSSSQVTLGDVYSQAINSFSDLSEEDFNLLIKTVFPFVRRMNESNWVPIYNKQANVFSFADVDSGTIIKILVEAMLEYLPPFFNVLNQLILGEQPVQEQA